MKTECQQALRILSDALEQGGDRQFIIGAVDYVIARFTNYPRLVAAERARIQEAIR
jgi:hypothetical protein